MTLLERKIEQGRIPSRDKGKKKEESGRCHLVAEGERCQRTLPVNHNSHGDT